MMPGRCIGQSLRRSARGSTGAVYRSIVGSTNPPRADGTVCVYTTCTCLPFYFLESFSSDLSVFLDSISKLILCFDFASPGLPQPMGLY